MFSTAAHLTTMESYTLRVDKGSNVPLSTCQMRQGARKNPLTVGLSRGPRPCGRLVRVPGMISPRRPGDNLMFEVRIEACTVTGTDACHWSARVHRGPDLADALARCLAEQDVMALHAVESGRLLVDSVCLRITITPSVPRRRLLEVYAEAVGLVGGIVKVVPEGLLSGDPAMTTLKDGIAAAEGTVTILPSQAVPSQTRTRKGACRG